MNDFFKLLMIITVFSLSLNTSFAQEKYKTHIVKTGENIRSIAKDYKVTPYDLIKLNPDVSDPPSMGTKIIVPSSSLKSESNNKAVTAEKNENPINDANIEGNVYHKVVAKETLYSLSKQYHVEVKDLYASNPILIEGLKTGMNLLIPQSNVVVEQRDKTKFIYHVIEPKETRWGLCHKYGITEEDLIANNPQVAYSVNIGDTIWIRKSEAKEIENISNINYNYTYYEVLPKDTNYGISKKFGIEVSVLKKENPNISKGLQIGMVLKIPKAPSVVYDTSRYEKIAYTNLPNDSKLTSVAKIEELDKIDIPKVVDVVLMLPFYLDKNKSFIHEASKPMSNTQNETGLTVEGAKVYPKSAIALDFYNGAMFAIDSLKNMGLSVRLRVFDTQKSLDVVKHILDENDFSGVDVVIGPLYTQNVEYVADRLKYDNVLVVSPLSKKLDLDNRFNLVQAMPSSYTTKNSVIKEIIGEADNSNVNVIVFGGLIDKTEVDFVQSRLKSSIDSNKVFTHIAKENLVNRDVVYRLLEPDTDNIVVIASKDDVLITDVITALNQVSDSLPNKAFLLSRPKVLDQLDSDYLNKVSLTYPEDYFVNNSDSKIVSFNSAFKRDSKYTPTMFAYRGFDVTYDILYSLGKNSNIEVGILKNHKRCVQGKFNYMKTPFGGYYNNSVFILRYDDWKLNDISKDL